MRKSFRIDWSKIKTKKQFSKIITQRKHAMQQVLKGQKTFAGIGKKQATRELKEIESLQKGKASTVYQKGWYQLRPLVKSAITVRRQGKQYVRTNLSWTSNQKQFISERSRMKDKDLANSFNQHFGMTRTQPSISMMKHRLK